MNVFRSIGHWFGTTARVFANEIRLVVHDPGVLIFFLALPLLYPIVYTLIYNPEVVNDIPVAVVDDCRSQSSRDLVQTLGAAPAFQIYDYCSNMADAKHLMAEGDVYAILKIPANYGKKLGRSETAHAEFFMDMGLLLRYRTFVSGLTDVQMKEVNDLSVEALDSKGLESYIPSQSMLPVKSQANFLGDTEQGFASFVIPGIVILILQQSMILGICMLGGTSRERRARNGGVDPEQVNGAGVSATVWGKALAYTIFYVPATIFVMHWIPYMFNLPMHGNPADYLCLAFPLLLSSAFFGLTLNIIMKQRESAFVIIVFTSVVLLFLSGLTWPRYAMPEVCLWLGNLIPGIWGVEGFIRINSNGANLWEVRTAYYALWILSALYFIFSMGVTAYISRKKH